MKKIAIIGAGNMGGAIAGGLVGAYDVVVANPHTDKLDRLKAAYKDIATTTDNVEAAKDADVVILAVKPWILPGVIEQLRPSLDPERQTIVSVVGGASIDDLDNMIHPFEPFAEPKLPPVFTVIPNTAIAVGSGVTFMASRRATEDMINEIEVMFGCMGLVAVVEERLMGAGTALASCGIAYVYKYIQACVQAGVEMGFRPAEALRYVAATVEGAAVLLRRNGTIPQQEIDKVTTAGGMTIRGINELEHANFVSALIRANKAPLKGR